MMALVMRGELAVPGAQFLFGGLVVMAGFIAPNGAADFGWFAYTPLSRTEFSPHVGGNPWAVGLILVAARSPA